MIRAVGPERGPTPPRAPVPHAVRSPLLALLAAATLLAAAPVSAQDEGEELAVRLYVAKASGELGEGEAPEVPEGLEAVAPALAALPFARYAFLGRSERPARPGAEAAFDLPGERRLDVRLGEVDADGRVRLELELTRPAREDEEGPRVRVLAAELEARVGRPCAVRHEDAFPDGQLLLLLSVSESRR